MARKEVVSIISQLFNPFTPESDQCQNSPVASQEIWHHTVRRAWLFIAYSDEKWLHYKFSLHHSYNRFLKGWEHTLFELRSERVNQSVFIYNQSQCLSWFEICKTFFEFLSQEWRNSQVVESENVCGILEAVRYKIRLSIYATCWRMVFGFKSVEYIFLLQVLGGFRASIAPRIGSRRKGDKP